MPGEVQDWVADHQARLMVAIERARVQLSLATDRRKERHDQRVHSAPLKVGQLVYLWDHSIRGQHKIQDLWSSVVYQVLRAPRRGGGCLYHCPRGRLGEGSTCSSRHVEGTGRPCLQPVPADLEADLSE